MRCLHPCHVLCSAPQRLQQLIFVLQDEAEENDDEVEDPPEEAASSWTEAQIREYYASKVLKSLVGRVLCGVPARASIEADRDLVD